MEIKRRKKTKEKVQHQRIVVEFLDKPPRYPTLDDYHWDSDGVLRFEIVDTDNPIYNQILLIHAIGEELLTRAKGIQEVDIFRYDNENRESEEPGDEVDCPYRDEHSIMTAVERLLLAHLGMSFKKYEEDLEALMSDE